MTRLPIPVSASLLALACATPALAGSYSAISVPEPTDAMLLLMGVAGVAIGRHMHARAARRGSDDARPAEDKTPDRED